MGEERPSEDLSEEVKKAAASEERFMDIELSGQTGPYVPVTTSAPAGPPGGPGARPFAPGAVVAGRYQIVKRIGQGGMGEVYEALDQGLEQPVALKFLLPALASDRERVERFKTEVRQARKVTHPNVCRIHDIGEHEGRPFFSMELIEDDLARLLLRVVRLAEEKALEVARDLCAALVAVHDQGLLHRDLKPANVLLDTRGKVKLTDFGLAALQGKVEDVGSGTPAYMAPEQLDDRQVGPKSDLFSLGLVLYELFTGKKAFPAATREELARLYAEQEPIPPSKHVGTLSPLVEAVLLRCLKHDPKDRPGSALDVQAELASAPLAAALAAGETPSPQLVIDADGEGRLRPPVALALLAFVLVGVVLFAWLNDFTALFRKVPQKLPPQALASKAEEIVRQVGYDEEPRDTDCGFGRDEQALKYLADRDRGRARWNGIETGQPAVLYFWYRQSPSWLVQRQSPNDVLGYGMPGRVTPSEPPLREPGMICVFLDPKGRLIELHAVPRRAAPEAAAPDEETRKKVDDLCFRKLFEAAKLGIGKFKKVEPRNDPPVFCTSHAAWEGLYPERPDLPVRVEAAVAHGRAVHFYLGLPEGAERLSAPEVPASLGTRLQGYLYDLVRFSVFTLGAWLAWRNVRSGRANVAGALRLAGVFGGAVLVKWALMAKHVPSFNDELAMLAAVLGRLLLEAATLCLIYLSVEPHVRRHWPWLIIGWNRLLVGRWRDPMVGRDVLIGGAAGVAGALLMQLRYLVPTWLGRASTPWSFWEVSLTAGPGILFEYLHYTIYAHLLEFFLLFLLLRVLSKPWLVVALWFLARLVSDTCKLETDHLWLMGALVALRLGLFAFVLLRFGLLAFIATYYFFYLLTELVLVTDLSVWYKATGLWAMVALGALAVHGYVRSLGGQSLLRAWPFADK
jgi:serine/threonine-protein kinase